MLPVNSPKKQGGGRPVPRSLLLFAALALLCSCGQQDATTSATLPPPLPPIADIQPKAEAGDPAAQNTLGEILAQGTQTKMDYKQAAEWYRKAAEQGHARAQYNLAVLYDIGQGVPHDETEAAQWCRKAAEQGDADAQYQLGGMYGAGRGVPFDPAQAIAWYQRAAAQGEPLSRFQLGQRFERGKNITADPVEALKWYILAGEAGLPDATAAHHALKSRLSSAQRSEAAQRAKDYNTAHPRKAGPR